MILIVLHVLTAALARASSPECKAALLAAVRNDDGLIDYLSTGNLTDSLVACAFNARDSHDSGKPLSSEHTILRQVLEDVSSIDLELEDVGGRPKADVPYEIEIEAGTFTFERLDYLGRHVISIRRPSDHFYWTIGVRYEGNFWLKGNGARIIGYYSIGTNGNLTDIRAALAATRQFFPAREIDRF